jgi:glycosyltransferase involved in cell wall biosynthesis
LLEKACGSAISIPEVDMLAQYFSPYDVGDMSRAIEKVVFSPSLQQDMFAKGKLRIKLFSWEKCARETMSVYKKVLSGF